MHENNIKHPPAVVKASSVPRLPHAWRRCGVQLKPARGQRNFGSSGSQSRSPRSKHVKDLARYDASVFPSWQVHGDGPDIPAVL